LIPDGLMQNQVKKDDSNIDVTRLDEIKYADYRKLEMGVGDYLTSLDFVTNAYAGKSGTLTAYRKKMWSSNDKGIPWLLRQEVERDVKRDKDSTGSPVNTGNTQSIQESVAIPELPSYLTQDLIWLCVCLYIHIAKCNHDHETEQKLKVFQRFIRDQWTLKASQEIQMTASNLVSNPTSRLNPLFLNGRLRMLNAAAC
jgi:hypothetical protein